jgi:hypothetical protein
MTKPPSVRQSAGARFPAPGRRLDQHRARHRAGFTHRLPRILHAGRAAGEHDAQLAPELGQQPLGALPLRPRSSGWNGRLSPQDARGWRRSCRWAPASRARWPAEDRAPRPPASAARYARPAPSRCAAPPLKPCRRGDGDPAVERHRALRHGQRIGRAQALARRQHAPADHQRAADGQARQQEAAAFRPGRRCGSLSRCRPPIVSSLITIVVPIVPTCSRRHGRLYI